MKWEIKLLLKTEKLFATFNKIDQGRSRMQNRSRQKSNAFTLSAQTSSAIIQTLNAHAKLTDELLLKVICLC